MRSIDSAAARVSIDLGEHAAQADVAGRDVERRGHVGGHVLHHAIFAATEHRVVRAAHADVGDERAAAGQDLRIGRRHMRVRAEDQRDAAVHPVPHRDLLAGGLGVNVADADPHAAGDLAAGRDRPRQTDRRRGGS